MSTSPQPLGKIEMISVCFKRTLHIRQSVYKHPITIESLRPLFTTLKALMISGLLHYFSEYYTTSLCV